MNIKNKNENFLQNLYLLKVLYGKLIEILEFFCRGTHFKRKDEVLNSTYIALIAIIEHILRTKGFEDLLKVYNRPFENLMGVLLEDLDIEWEYGFSPDVYSFYGKIEEIFIKSGAKTYSLPKELTDSFRKIEEYMKDTKECDEKFFKQFIKKTKELIKKYPLSSGQSSELPVKPASPKELYFDEKLCKFHYKDQVYSLQRRKSRCQILRELWKHRRIEDSKGKIKRDGGICHIDTLAQVAGFEERFERKVRDAIQALNNRFKSVNAPVKIESHQGFILIVRQK